MTSESLVVCLVLKHIESFLGIDGLVYPAAYKGDIISYPLKEALVLQEKKVVEILDNTPEPALQPSAALAEYESKHPDFFPPGTSTDAKEKHIKKIAQKRKNEQAQKLENFARLDTSVEEKEKRIAAEREEQAFREEAEEIYLSGKFPESLLDVFRKIWCGDDHILRWVMVAFANGFVANSDEGLHLYISGASGLGKSESVKKSMSLLPTEYSVSAQFSKKGFLYRAETLKPGTLVLHDDHTFGEEEAGLYRAMIAGWREKSKYCTVDKLKSKEIIVPERITQISTSVDGLSTEDSSGQNESRYCTIEISRNAETLDKIFDFIKNPVLEDTQHEREVIMAIWSIITTEKKAIEIPFIEDIIIDDSAKTKIREFKKFLCLIRALALLHGRTTTTIEDFAEAQKMWTYLLVMIDNEVAGLTKTERVVFEKIIELSKGGNRVELSRLKNSLSTSETMVYRSLYGRNGSFHHITGGLLTKVRGLTIEQKYDKDSGESDRIITFNKPNAGLQSDAPYTLKGLL